MAPNQFFRARITRHAAPLYKMNPKSLIHFNTPAVIYTKVSKFLLPFFKITSTIKPPIKNPAMVVPLGPGKFYGGSLPRPRFYSDTKFNPDRVDPPLPVMEPLLSWANEAHWSMGGLSFKRLRLQGRIEGNVNKLRRQIEKLQKNSPYKDSTVDRPGSKRAASVSPPPAPAAVKRRRYLALCDSDSDSDSEDNDRSDGEFMPKKEKMAFRRGAVRKLGDDFERVARESSSAAKGKSSNGVGLNVMKIVNEINDGVGFEGEKTSKKALKNGSGVVQSGTRTSPRLASGTRTSPRLANRRMN